MLGTVKNLTLRDVTLDVSGNIKMEGRKAAMEIGGAATSVKRLILDNVTVGSEGDENYHELLSLSNVLKVKIANSSFSCDTFMSLKTDNTSELQETNNDFTVKNAVVGVLKRAQTENLTIDTLPVSPHAGDSILKTDGIHFYDGASFRKIQFKENDK